MTGILFQVDRIIFTVFLPLDQQLYSKLLHVYFPLEEQTANEETVEDEGEEAEDDGTEKEEEGRAAIATPYTLQKSVTEPGRGMALCGYVYSLLPW